VRGHLLPCCAIESFRTGGFPHQHQAVQMLSALGDIPHIQRGTDL
jgi:hypothetical protein